MKRDWAEVLTVAWFILFGLMSAAWIAVLIWLCLSAIDWLGRH